MRDCLLLSERAGWLLAGNYGKGAYDEAWRIVKAKRGNRTAALGQLLAAMEWRGSSREARAAWGRLTATEQAEVTQMLDDAMAVGSAE